MKLTSPKRGLRLHSDLVPEHQQDFVGGSDKWVSSSSDHVNPSAMLIIRPEDRE